MTLEPINEVRKANAECDLEIWRRHRKIAAERKAMTVACPKCGSVPEQSCFRRWEEGEGMREALMHRPHKERVAAGEAADA